MGNGFSRRNFLKGSGIMLGGLASAPIARAQSAVGPWAVSEPILNQSTAFATSHWGAFYADVEGQRITRIRPFKKDTFPSPSVQSLADRTYARDRIQYPMVRESFLKHGANSDTAQRGAEGFVRVSWDKAIDLVASELQRVKKEHGNLGIYAGSYGWKSPGHVNSTTTLLHRMLSGFGGYVDLIGDYSTGASQVIMPYVVGSLAVYEQQTAWPVVLKHTDTVVLWGVDPLVTNQIDWLTPDHYAYETFKKLKNNRRIKVIAINPAKVDSVEYLGAKWIAPRPNTDVALMLGIAHELHKQGLVDKKFLQRYTVGFDPFEAYLLGKSDGQPKTAEWASSISGVDKAAIADLAKTFAQGRTMLMSGWGIQRQDHGEQVHWMLVTLAAMLGQIGLPGGGFGLSYHYCSGGAPTAHAPQLGGISGSIGMAGAAGEKSHKRHTNAAWLHHGSAAVPVARFSDLFLNPGKTIDFNGKKITYPDIRLVYWTGGNPFSHQEQRNRLIEAWRRPETIIVQDSFWTATAKFADIVLPATTTLERNDISSGGFYSNRFIFAMQKVVDPLFEARDDYTIFKDISDRLGFGDKFTENRSAMDWVKHLYDEAHKQAKTMKIDMPDFEGFWKKGYVEFKVPHDAENYVTYAEFRKNPMMNPLGTASGRIQIFSKEVAKYKYDDCPPHPTWLEPAEWLGSPKAKEYPLHLLSPHPKDRLHSQLDNTWIREWYEIHGREPIWINSDDAKSRGIKDGDVVRVFNDRGEVLAGALVTSRVMPGVVRMHEGGWYDPQRRGEKGSLGKHGDVNILTLDKGTSKLAQGNIANTALVQVEKLQGKLPRITAFAPPAQTS